MKDYNININLFILSEKSFFEQVLKFYKRLDRNGLENVIPKIIADHYNFNTDIQKNESGRIIDFEPSPLLIFLKRNFFQYKDTFLGLIQLTIDDFNLGVLNSSYRFSFDEEVIKLFSNPVFDLDFYYDKSTNKIKKKVDIVTNEQINSIDKNLTQKNKELYEKCVEEFLQFDKKTFLGSHSTFYHESLDKIKEVFENTLTINYPDTRISEGGKLQAILFDGQNEDFKPIHEFIIKKIHHNSTGEQIKINEKEYNYLWLEINKLIYLLLRYKK